MAIAALLDEFVGAARAHTLYERIDRTEVCRYEVAMEETIADFISRSESQRPAVIRKLPDEVTQVCFLTLAILGCVRARDVMVLRDRYRELLAPGRGNRETTRGLYRFSNVVQGLIDYDWPEAVFSDLGTDDQDASDDDGEREAPGARPREANSGTLKPTIPPPPPPAAPPTSTEVVVTIGTSETVRASPSADKGAWKLQAIEETGSTVLMALLTQEMARGALVAQLLKVADMPWGRKPPILLFSHSQRSLVAEVNASAGREIAAVMRAGVTSLAFMKWPEELLRSIKRELELVGEPMTTAAELFALKKSWLISGHADPTANWEEQRDDVERWVKSLLAHRGRWTGPVPPEEPRGRRLQSAIRDLAKLKRTVTKLANTERTAYGDAFYEIAGAALAWRTGEMTTEAAKLRAGRAYIEYLFRTAGDQQNVGRLQLGFEIDDAIGEGSAEKDLLEAGVLQLMSGPFESGRSASLVAESEVWSEYRAQAGPRGWFMAWWYVLEVEDQADLGDRRWMPSGGSLTNVAGSGLPAGVTVRVGDSLVPLVRTPESADLSWVDAKRGECLGHAGSLISWIGGRLGFAHYSGYRAEGCTRWGLPVVVNGPTEESVVSARKAWAGAAKQIAACFGGRDAKGKRPRPPTSLRVCNVAEGFLEPLIATRERLALMAGRKWDAEARWAK